MRVDNFVQVVNYDGTTVGKITNLSELYAVKWRPTRLDSFEDTPPSPRVVQSARKPVTSSEEEPKKQAYRPPGGSGALAEQMRKERELENQKKAVKVKIVDASGAVPGMTAAPTGPSASALRNARKKAAAAAAVMKQQQEIAPVKEQEATDDVQQGTDPAKRIRNLQKKLKEIATLKESGVTLSAAQQAKVDSEQLVLAEIAQLTDSIN